MTVRSKRNNLLNYFLYDNKDLSKAYVKKCEQFIDSLGYKNKLEDCFKMEKNNECRRKRTLDRKQSNRVV